LTGLITLAAANFALTPSQSVADFASGTALTPVVSRGAGGSALSYGYSNVKGEPYASFRAYYNPSNRVADNLDLGAANALVLYGNDLTISRGVGGESLLVPTSAGPSAFSLAYHASETVEASAAGAETFRFSSGFGSETINGLTLSGSNADAIQLSTSAFSYLTAGMTQAQDLAAMLAHATSSPSAVTLWDSAGDALALPGLNASTISASASQFQFV